MTEVVPKYAKAVKLRDARANFSHLVETVGKDATTYIVEKRGKVATYLVDPATAEKYLPKRLTTRKPQKKKSGGQLFYEEIMEWRKKYAKRTKPQLENISENVDKYVYRV